MNLRHPILIALSCCFGFFSYAQNGQMLARGHRATPQTQPKPAVIYELLDFIGKWQEVKREDPKKKTVAFKDTALLHFNDDKTVESRNTADDKMAMRSIEKASIDDDNTLMTADQDYTALSVSKDAMVLKDQDDSIHYFKKVDMFAYELEDAGGPGKNPTTSEADITKISLANIMGNWTVYKRQAKPGFITPSSVVLKYINLTKKVDKNTASGTATIYQGETSHEVPCMAVIHGKNIKISTADASFDLPVKVADGKEFDFGTTDMMYFCKQL